MYMTEIDLPTFAEYQLNLPAFFAVKTNYFGDPKRKTWWKLANPLSTARNLATRKKESSVNLVRSGIIEPEVEIENENNDRMLVEQFSSGDQLKIRKWLKADKTKNFAIRPVLPRGRPETMPANIEYKKGFRGYDEDFLQQVKLTKDGRIISKKSFGGFKPGESSTHYQKTPSIGELGEAIQNLFNEVDDVEDDKVSSDSWIGELVDLLNDFGDEPSVRDDILDEVRSAVDTPLSAKSVKIIKTGTPRQVANAVDALLFAPDTPSTVATSIMTPSTKPPTPKAPTPKKKYTPRSPDYPPPGYKPPLKPYSAYRPEGYKPPSPKTFPPGYKPRSPQYPPPPKRKTVVDKYGEFDPFEAFPGEEFPDMPTFSKVKKYTQPDKYGYRFETR